MTSLTDLHAVVDVVIGVDTHVESAAPGRAVVDTAADAVLGESRSRRRSRTVHELVEFANNHAMLRAWAIEGTGGQECCRLQAGICWRSGSRTSSWTARSRLRGATSAKLYGWMRSGHVRRWLDPGWGLP